MLATVFAGTVGLAWLVAAPAVAHDNLVRAVPADGATVTTAPGQVRLVFDETVQSATIVVAGPSGTRVERGPVRVRGKRAGVRVDVTKAGRYTVGFRVVSADGHPVAAQTSFSFSPGGTARPGTAQPSASSAHAGHDGDAAGDGSSRGRVIGVVAGAGLIAGLGLLTVRRLPGGIVNPGSTGTGQKDRP
jgi:methionine-rich copper-binding protein CopC